MESISLQSEPNQFLHSEIGLAGTTQASYFNAIGIKVNGIYVLVHVKNRGQSIYCQSSLKKLSTER